MAIIHGISKAQDRSWAFVVQSLQYRARLMTGVNRADQDEPSRVRNDQEMTILKEMNAFEDDHVRFMDSLKGVE